MNDDKSRIRHPITIYVDNLEFEPDIDFTHITKTAYDIELTGYDVRKLFAYLEERLKSSSEFPPNVRIRVIGRLVS